MKSTSRSRALIVLGAATGLNFLTGILYIWSILSNELVTEWHWTSKEASLPYTVATVSFVLFMVVFGRLQDSKGPRFTATFSATLMGAGLILSGLISTPLLMIVTFGVIAGAGIGIGSISTMPPAVKWFPPEKKGQITGIVVAGIGMASVFFAPVSAALLNSVGISLTFLFCGIGVLFFGLIFASLLKNPPDGYIAVGKKEAQDSKKPDSFAKDMNSKEMLKTSSFYRLWLMLAFSSSAGLMIIGHTATIARVQANWEGGYILVVLLAVFNTLGRFLGGAVSDKIGRINLMRIIFLLQAANMLLFSHYDSVVLLAVGIAVAGLNYGAIFSVYPAATVDFYGIKNVGANYGIIFTGYGAGGLIGPMMAAAIFDATSSYNFAYIIACILLLISLTITFSFRISNKEVSVSQSLRTK